MFQTKVAETNIFYDQLLFFPESRAVYGIIWENTEQPDRHRYQYNTEHVLTCWIPKATDTHNNGYANAPKWQVIRTLPVWLILDDINPLNPELNPICYLLALLAHHILHVSRIRVKSLTVRLLMSYIYAAPILDVSRSHTTTQHSR